MSLGQDLSKFQKSLVDGPYRAALVHIFTASGVVCNLLAILALAQSDYRQVFIWIGVALIIDGIDGPLARSVEVKKVLPRYSGERLDLIIDYLTYVFVPVLALLHAGFLPGIFGGVLAALILLSSLHHFCDEYSKTDDNYFVGFPAIWCFVVFHIFAAQASFATTAIVTLVCVALTFVPTKYVHPVRVETWRPLTLAMTALWGLAAVWIVITGFPGTFWANVALNVSALYGAGLCVWAGFAKLPQD
jgi:phosphatidylcholine synthase